MAFDAMERELARFGAPSKLRDRARKACADETRHASQMGWLGDGTRRFLMLPPLRRVSGRCSPPQSRTPSKVACAKRGVPCLLTIRPRRHMIRRHNESGARLPRTRASTRSSRWLCTNGTCHSWRATSARRWMPLWNELACSFARSLPPRRRRTWPWCMTPVRRNPLVLSRYSVNWKRWCWRRDGHRGARPLGWLRIHPRRAFPTTSTFMLVLFRAGDVLAARRFRLRNNCAAVPIRLALWRFFSLLTAKSCKGPSCEFRDLSQSSRVRGSPRFASPTCIPNFRPCLQPPKTTSSRQRLTNQSRSRWQS